MYIKGKPVHPGESYEDEAPEVQPGTNDADGVDNDQNQPDNEAQSQPTRRGPRSKRRAWCGLWADCR